MEFQALADLINVYNADPVAGLGMPATGKPIISIIDIQRMLEDTTLERIRFNFLRIHRQALMGNERRYSYDYSMLCCGPIPLCYRVAQPDKAVAAFAASGPLDAKWQAALPPSAGERNV